MNLYFAILALCIFSWSQIALAADKLSLAGTWRYQLDPADIGIFRQWSGRILTNTLNLPGSLPEQGIGDDVTLNTPWTGSVAPSWMTDPKYAPYRQPGNIKLSFLLTPDKYYVGPAWYQREIGIPVSWNGSRVLLSLERPHWGTTVWVDGTPFGTYDSLAAPHQYDLGKLTTGSHLLTIRVDNRLIIDIGNNSSSVTDHTQGNWNGIVGDISLTPANSVRLDDVQVYPHVSTKSITLKGALANPDQLSGTGELLIKIADRVPTGRTPILMTKSVVWNALASSFSIEVPLGADAPIWDEFTPALLDLNISLSEGTQTLDSRQLNFGLREIAANRTQFVLNGHNAFLRGTMEACVFPNSGHPPMDIEPWRRIVRIAKSYGLNHIRFHTWCPPEAAFEAADELGFYYQVECAAWSLPGDGTALDAWLYTEADRILKAYGNHPSFLLMASGNEPWGAQHDEPYLNQWVAHYKAKDARRLFTGTSGFPEIPENQFHVSWPPRITAWGQNIDSWINAQPPHTTDDFRYYVSSRNVPVISHEIGEWCVYPNFDEIAKYTNYLKAKDLEIFHDFLEEHQMADLARPFLQASGKLQVLLYKEEIESALRTPGMGGFQLLGLTDFPGQGPALVGVLDSFWDEKGYVTAAEYSRFCNSTVPLLRLEKRVFTEGEILDADAEAAHFGAAPLPNIVPAWALVAENGIQVASGTLPSQTLPIGSGISLGSLHINLAGIPSPARYRLALGLAGTRFTNDWDVWVYPSLLPPEPSEKPIITQTLTPAILGQLTNGVNVLLALPLSRADDPPPGRVQLGFSSIFWNTAWFLQPPTTLGILCDPSHPLFKYFPTDSHSNWQWWYLIFGAEAMVLDNLSADLNPTVRVIDDWFTARRLAMLFETKVGLGKLIVSTIKIQDVPDLNRVSRQFRYSLLKYMASADFIPKTEMTVAALADSGLGLFSAPPVIVENPQNVVRQTNRAASFSAQVTGTLPFQFAWLHDRLQAATGISSNRTISLRMPNITSSDAGSYVLRVSNLYGTNESAPVTLSILNPAPGTYVKAILDKNPIAYWPFDEATPSFSGALDVAGDHYMSHTNVFAANGPAPADFMGFSTSNVAGAYNGFDSGSQAGELSLATLSQFTICGWFKPKEMPQPARTALFGQNDFVELGFHDAPGTSNGALGVWVAGPTPPGYGTSVLLANTESRITAGKWHFVTVTADSAQVSLFLNGTLVASAPGSVQDYYASKFPFRAGFGTLDQTGNNFNGSIDEVAVFDRALSGEDIKLLYNTALKSNALALYIQQENGQVTMIWPSGILQSTDQIGGSFSNVPGAVSPYTNSITNREKFFRLQLKQ